MRTPTALFAVVFLTTLAAAAAHGDSVNLSEDWFVRITNFSLYGEGQWPHPMSIDLVGFSGDFSYQWSTTPLIEPKLESPDPQYPYNFGRLFFDFHGGLASTNDRAGLYPFPTIGSEWGGTMSFSWQIYCTDPRFVFMVGSMSMDDAKVWWSAPTQAGYRTGTSTFSVATWGTLYAAPPAFIVQFTPVPEPAGVAVLLCAISSVVLHRRKLLNYGR